MAGITCQPYRESYVKTKRVTCMVDSPGVNDFKEGPILVKVKGVELLEGEGDERQLVTFFFVLFTTEPKFSYFHIKFSDVFILLILFYDIL